MWLARTFPDVQFARYVDDAVVHCRSEARAIQVRDAIAQRLQQVGLRLHPDKTRIVYCQDSNRRGSYEHTSFTFLGFTFQQREARSRRGQNFSGFLPARSDAAQRKMNATVRSWKLHYKTNLTLDDLARWINPIVRGWMQYYGAFYRSKAVSPAGAHQRLPDAVPPPQAQTVTGQEEGPPVLEQARRHPARPVRPLGMGHLAHDRLVIRMTGAR
jgi:hypothetical protein